MEHVIEFENVSKSFGHFSITDVSFQVKKGFVNGIIGSNGAGKSTIMKLMLNLLQPDCGKISILGMNYAEHEKSIKERIGFVFSEDFLYEELNLKDMSKIIAPSYRHWDHSLFHYYCETFELPLQQKIK